MGRKPKPSDELPTHYLKWRDKNGKQSGVWRVRLMNPHGYTDKDGKRFFTVLPDPNMHRGVDTISDVPEERLLPIVPLPRIARMLERRYELYVRKQRGRERYMLYWRRAACEDAPFQWSHEDLLEVEQTLLCDEAKLREVIEVILGVS